MSKHDKTISKLTSRPAPTDLKWNDLVSLLTHLGYEQFNGKGSRRKFIHRTSQHMLSLHEPHPQDVIKQYVARYVAEELSNQALIDIDTK